MSKGWDVYASRVKKLIKERGITQGELAELVGTTQETMSRYLKGKRTPNASVILSTAKILKVSCDYLVGLSTVQTTKAVGAVKQEVVGELIRCKDCKWWGYDDDDGVVRVCHAAKHGHMSSNWDIMIYRKHKENFYCADAERREEGN